VKNPLVYALLAALALFIPLAGMEFPADGFAAGWKRSGPVETYVPTALYNVIDGGAELFLEMGFVDLRMQKYEGAGGEIAVEAYRMDSAAAAMGIYLLKCSRETPVAEIGERNSGDRFQIALLKNNYFIFINSFSGREDLLPVMAALARQVAASIPAGEAVRELDILPVENRAPGWGCPAAGRKAICRCRRLPRGLGIELHADRGSLRRRGGCPRRFFPLAPQPRSLPAGPGRGR
jgi:hypothetical protein